MSKGFQKNNEWRFKKGRVPWNKRKPHLAMENNPNWKGGRMIGSGGYVLIKMREHPRANNCGYIREHRLVMEKYLGRYLKPSEIVHHLDGNRQNNKIENLLLTKSSRHWRMAEIIWKAALKIGVAKKILKELTGEED